MKKYLVTAIVSCILLVCAVSGYFLFATVLDNDVKGLWSKAGDEPDVQSNMSPGTPGRFLAEGVAWHERGVGTLKTTKNPAETSGAAETDKARSEVRINYEQSLGGYRANPMLVQKIDRGERLEETELLEASAELRRLDAHIQKSVRNGAHVSDKTRKYYLGLQKAYMEAMLARAPSSVGGEATAERLRRYLQERAKLLRSMDGSDLEIHAKERALKRKILSGNGL